MIGTEEQENRKKNWKKAGKRAGGQRIRLLKNRREIGQNAQKP
ncbi:hypothetical protein [Brotaphodocola sp.]